MEVYFVTMLEKLEKGTMGLPEVGEKWTIGYFETFDQADQAVAKFDVFVDIHNYALIEKVPSGLLKFAHADKDQRWLYKYNEKKMKFEKIKEPDYFKKVVGYACG